MRMTMLFLILYILLFTGSEAGEVKITWDVVDQYCDGTRNEEQDQLYRIYYDTKPIPNENPPCESGAKVKVPTGIPYVETKDLNIRIEVPTEGTYYIVTTSRGPRVDAYMNWGMLSDNLVRHAKRASPNAPAYLEVK